MKKKANNIKIICTSVIMLLLLNNLFIIPIVLSDENNTPPVVSDENPLNGSMGISTSITEISVIIEDLEGDLFNWSIETSPDIGSILSDNQGNGTKICSISNLDYDTTYYWYVNATDEENSTSEIYSFTTGSEPQKTISLNIGQVYPNNEQANYDPRLEVTISGYSGDPLNVLFRTNAMGSWQTIGTLEGGNGKYTQYTSGMDIEGETYYWSINITDGDDWENRSYNFEAQPFVLKWSRATNAITTVGPLAVDVNDDGVYEVFATGDNRATCVDGLTGNIIWQYNDNEIELHSPFEIYDLNNDGVEEIVISGREHPAGQTMCLHADDGSLYWKVPIESGSKYFSIADINGDGYPYVFVCSADPNAYPPETGQGRLRKLDGTTGAVLKEVFTWRPCWGGPSIADAEGDGKFEVYLTDRSSSYNWPDNKLAKGMQCYDAETLELLWYDEDVLCSSHGIVVVDVNEDGVLDGVAFQQVGNGIYTIDGATGVRMPGYWGQGLPLAGHSHIAVYDVDEDGSLELITARSNNAKVWDMDSWQVEATLDYFNEPPKMADVIGDEQLEIIGALSDIIIYDGTTYDEVGRINSAVDGNTIVQDIDNDGQNELLAITGDGILRCWDTSAYAPTPRVRTNSQYYSERNLGAGVYTPLPGPPQPILKDEYPINGSEYVELNPTLSVHAVDFRYDLMNITISTNASGSWVDVKTFTDVGNDDYSYSPNNMNAINTKYYWKVTGHDPYVDDLTTTEIYHFTTVANAPYISNPIPADGVIRVPIDTSELSIDLADYPDHEMDYSIQTVPDVGSRSGNNVDDGTYTLDLDSLEYFTTYTWYVNVTDGTYSTSEVFTFMTEPELLIVDSEFSDSADSGELRTDGSGQDWYCYSQTSLVTLDTSDVGGNKGKKVKFEASDSASAFLCQEFIQDPGEHYNISFDVYVDNIIDLEDEDDRDRAGWIFIGDNSNAANGPCFSDNERFVYLAFYKNGGGSKGTMDLMAYERYGSWKDFTIIAEDLLLDHWYTMEIKIDLRLNRYTVYIDGEHQRTVKPRTWLDELTYICFAQLSNGAGSFYIDNVFSPVEPRYRLNVIADPLTGGEIEISPGESTYENGAIVTLTPTANPGWEFSGWEGDITSSQEDDEPLIISMDEHKTINAIFDDIESPLISDISAVKTNISGNVIISYNVTDNELLNHVKVNVKYPNNDIINFTATSDDEILTYDDFEGGWGHYSDGGSDCSISDDDEYVLQGNYAACIQDNSGTSSSFYHTNGIDIDTPGYQSLKIDFWFITENMTYDDEEDEYHDFWVLFWDGDLWYTIADYDVDNDFFNDVPYHKIIYINEMDYNFSTNMKIAFQCDAYNNSQRVYIDQIYINATRLSENYLDNIYDQTGTYQYYIWADDVTGNGQKTPTYSFELNITNLDPKAEFTYTPSNPSTSDLITIDSSNSTDTDGFIVNWTWDFDDGVVGYGKNITHQYVNNGIYNVELIVTDNNGSTDEITKPITVSNVPPTAEDDSEDTSEDVPIWIEVLYNDIDNDGTLNPSTVTITDGPLHGSTIINTTTGEIRYTPDSDYFGDDSFNYTVDDDDGDTSNVATVTISISSLPDKPKFSGATPTGSGVSISTSTLSVTITDLEGDIFDWTITTDPNIGASSGNDSSNGTKNCSISSLSYSQSYSWTVRAVDNDGWTNVTYTFTTQSAPGGGGGGDPGGGGTPPQPPKPTAKANGPYTGFVNEEIQFSASGSSAYDKIENYTWSFGDEKAGYGINPTHSFSAQGTYKVILTVKDNFGVTDEDETTVVIVTPNIIPDEPVVNGPQKGTKNTKYAYTASSIDGDNDTIQYNFDWDDGTSNTSGFIPSGEAAIFTHMWTSAGKYTLEVQAYDNQTPSDIARYLILIDAMMIDDTAYITDDDGDGIYDTYYNGEIETQVEMKDGKYLIDTDGDGVYNNKFDSETGDLTDYTGESGTSAEDYTVIIMIVVAVIIIIVLIAIMIFIKNKKTPPKDKK